ncbi:MAG: response regulator [Methanobacteriota archaeon]
MAATHPPPEGSSRRLRFLVVDDERDILEAVRDVLLSRHAGAEVATADRGTAALERVSRERFDLIVADYRMPGMDGLEFLTLARRMQPRTPRILMTAYPDLAVTVRAINEAGVSKFLTKPFDGEALLSAVRHALEGERGGEARAEKRIR